MTRFRTWLRTAWPAALVVLGLGCDPTFDPKGTYENRLVLFALLTPGSDSVQVRLQTTYDPPTTDPLAPVPTPALTGATGTLTWGTGQAVLRDTLVPHPDTTRHAGGLHLLTSAARVQRGATYTVRVDVPGYGPAEATTTVPGSAPLMFGNEDLLRQPSSYPGAQLGVIIGLAPQAFGFLPKLVLEYEVISQGNRLERREVPSSLIVTSSDIRPAYPTIRGTTSERATGQSSYELFEYEANAYRYLLQRLYETYGRSDLRFRRAVLTVTVVDRHLFTYYFLVNGFFDPYTVRTDLPDHSNVRGGVGIVGSYAVDSLVVDLPPSI
jgi:hypothetical protein